MSYWLGEMIPKMEEQLYPDDSLDNAITNGTAGKIRANPGVRFDKIPLKFDIETLDLLLAYAYEDKSRLITRASLINLKNLVDMCNMNLYRNNQSLKIRIDFLKLLLEAKLENGLDNKKLLLNYAIENCEYKELVREEVIPELNKLKLNSRAIQHLNGFIADRLIYGFMYAYKDEVFRIYEDMESNNFKTLKDLTKLFKLLLNDLVYDIRNAENYKRENITLDLSNGNFENIVTQIVEKLQDPNNKLKTGSQALNFLLNGGFEATRSYLFYGITGIGKSVLLLNLCVWILNFNKIKTKDEGRRAAVLYITQENSIAETVERLFNMLVTGDDIRDYSPSEVVHLLRTKGQLILKNKDDIDFIVKYYDDKEISTMDLYSIIDDIEDTGREVIVLIHDYIERIRSSRNHTELRLELAEIANDYSVLAKRLDIPVIGAGQLNRKGSDIIDSALEANRTDLARLLGKGTISESYGMLKNLDSAYIIHKEMDLEGNEYITFLDMKHRSRAGKRKEWSKYLAHPLDPKNGIKLLDDLHLDKPLSKTTLDDRAQDLNIIKRSKSLRELKNLRKESVEIIDDDAIMNFKFLGDAIKKRKEIEQKTDKITDKKADNKFNKIVSTYNEQYKRNINGFINITESANRHYVRNSNGFINIIAKK